MRNNKIIIAVIILIVVATGGYLYVTSEDAAVEEQVMNDEVIGYMDVNAQEAKDLIDNNPEIIIVDVSPVYANGHLPGAINYYFGDGTLDAALPTLDKEATYLVYCHVPSASEIGAQKFIDAGFKNVYRLEDHYSGWVAAGYEIEK